MTPEERREALENVTSYGFDSLMAYLDAHEPAVADAIRYGLKEVPCGCDCGELLYKPASRP